MKRLKKSDSEELIMNNSFDSFMINEYKNLSNCHFESVKQVSIFFRYYLLILAAPFLIFSLISAEGKGLANFLEGKDLLAYYYIVGLYFFIVSLIGLSLLLYITNLRHDAVLYAKSVNQVRRYFFDRSNLQPNEKNCYIGLPIIASLPKYYEKTLFYPLIVVFSLINSSFLFAAGYFSSLKSPYIFSWSIIGDLPLSIINVFILTLWFFLLHFLLYGYLSFRRRVRYFKSYDIGIDIDGVLNNQTTCFCEWLKKLTDIEISANDIKDIPVSLNKSLNVQNIHERIVFNTKEYWEALKINYNAALRINELQKGFGLKVQFFTKRNWPQYGNDIDKIKSSILEKGYTPLAENKIKEITIEWLSKNNLYVAANVDFYSLLKNSYHKYITRKSPKILNFDNGNPFTRDKWFTNRIRFSTLNENRFSYAERNGLKFFVEDDLPSAIRLSLLCDFIFLYNQPYNQSSDNPLPKNIIRVESWDDIFRKIKLII